MSRYLTPARPLCHTCRSSLCLQRNYDGHPSHGGCCSGGNVLTDASQFYCYMPIVHITQLNEPSLLAEQSLTIQEQFTWLLTTLECLTLGL